MNANKINILILFTLMLCSIQISHGAALTAKKAKQQENFLNQKLLMAVEYGTEKEIKEAIAEGADINYMGNNQNYEPTDFYYSKFKYTPLYLAALGHSLNRVKLLIKNGADINKGLSDGTTPLTIAAAYGDLNTVKFLVDNGAKIDEKAIESAERGKHYDTEKFLKEKLGARRQKEVEEATPLASALVGLVEEYEGYKEPSKEIHESE